MTPACWRWAPTLTSSSSASRRRADTSPTIRPEALDNLAHENLRAVAAMHVSQENNTYRLPRETFEAVIAEHGLSTTVSVAFQNRLVTIG